MKLTTTTSTQTTVRGQLSESELLDFIRQTFAFPEGAEVSLYVSGTCETVMLSSDTPLQFKVNWRQENKPLPEQEVPMRIVTTRSA